MGADVGGGDKAKSEPNVVPLCDVLLVLLIIFMVVTPMIQKGANVTLPEARHLEDQPDPGKLIEVTLRRDGQIYVEEKLVEDLNTIDEQIIERMEERQITDKKILLKADLEVDYGRIVDLMNAIKRADIEVIGLVSEQQAGTID